MEQTPSCKYFRLLADEYIEGELTGEEMREFEAHIAECPECRKEFEELRALKEMLAGSDEEIPEGLHERIMNAVSSEIKPRGNRLRVLRRAVVSAACAVICLSLTVAFALMPLWQENTGSGLPEDPLTDAAAGETLVVTEENVLPEINNSSVITSTTDEVYTSEAEEITVAEDTDVVPSPEGTSPNPNDTNAAVLTSPETMVIPETARPETEASPVETEAPATEATAERPESDAAAEPKTEALAEIAPTGTHHSASLKDDTLAPSPEANTAPGGDEITFALLIVSGLLAVASFIAFLISLSSVRNTPSKKNREEEK